MLSLSVDVVGGGGGGGGFEYDIFNNSFRRYLLIRYIKDLSHDSIA